MDMKVLSLLVLTAHIAMGQAPSGAISGIVTDPSGATVPGAVVTAQNGKNKASSVKSDGDGKYTINIPAGTYTVRAGAKGFSVFEKPGVDVAGGATAALPISLSIAMDAQAVSVTEQIQVSTEASQNVGALVLNGEDLSALPDDPDDLASDLQALAGPAAGPNGGQIYIDGFTGGQLPPKASIREIRVNSNPFSSEYDRLGFGRIEIFTKPGSDKFRGSAFFNYGDAVFNARNPYSLTRAPFRSELGGANLSGPLGKRASFNIDFNARNVDESALIVASVLDKNLNIVPYNATVPTPQTLYIFNPRLDFALDAKNTLVARYMLFDRTSDNNNVGQFNLQSQATRLESKEQTVQLTETAILSSRAINETRFQYIRLRSTTAGTSGIPTITVQDAFTDGGASLTNNFTNQDNYEAQNYTTISFNKHNLKFGGRVRGVSEETQATGNYNGTYTFAGGIYPAIDGSTTTQQLTSIQVYQQAQILLSKGYTGAQIAAAGYGPNQFTLTSGIPRVGIGQYDLGLFVQDDWRIRPDLTVNFGMRFETQTNISNMASYGPRVGFAYALPSKGGKPSKTVIRGGFGIFYDRISESLSLNVERQNGITQQLFVVTNPIFYPAVPTSDQLVNAKVTQSVYTMDSNLRAPYTMQSAIGFERQLPKNITLAMNYTNSRGVHILRTRNINAPLPGTYDPNVPGSGIRPYGSAEGNIDQYESGGMFKQSQLITNINARVSPKLALFGFYAYGHAHSNTDGVGSFPANSYDLSTEWGRATFDVRHRMFLGGSITGPYKLSFNPFIVMNSGAPFNIVTGRDGNGDGVFTDRPALATDLTRPSVVRTAYGNFDVSPLPGVPIIPRNYAEGPGQISINLRLSRTWAFGNKPEVANGAGGGGMPPGMMMGGGGGGRPGGGGPPMGGGGGGPMGMFGGGSGGKRYSITTTISARNLINHVNPGTPSGSLSSPFFGESTSLGGGFGPGGPGGGPGGGGSGAAANRRLELQVRFTF
jgi:hypothetical protein